MQVEDELALVRMDPGRDQTLEHAAREAVHTALEEDDYRAFKAAIADSPLADIITSRADFEQFQEAHRLRQAGNWDEAEDIMDELGVTHPGVGGHHHLPPPFISDLTDEQREALQVARQSNDRATIQAIFDEAGIELPVHHYGRRTMN